MQTDRQTNVRTSFNAEKIVFIFCPIDEHNNFVGEKSHCCDKCGKAFLNFPIINEIGGLSSQTFRVNILQEILNCTAFIQIKMLFVLITNVRLM